MYKNISLIDNLLSYHFIDFYKVTRKFVKGNIGMIKVALLYAGFKSVYPGMKIDTKAGIINATSIDEYRMASDNYFRKAKIQNEVMAMAKEYSWLDVKGKDVIDIGANIGDSAIYFARRGAKHIYSYEPFPYSFDKAKINIKHEGIEKRVSLYNEGVSGKEETIKINKQEKSTGGSQIRNFKKGKRIKIRTLEYIVKSTKINNAILKMDCEGSEYEILQNTDSHILQKFCQIEIEYHYGYINIATKLKASGFNVKIGRPTRIHNPKSQPSNMMVGLIFAKRHT